MWHPRTWPWWAWVLVLVATLVLLAVSFALAIRNQGMHELRTTIDELHAQGFGVLPRELVARAPAVDPLRQERAWTLFGTNSSWKYRTEITYGPVASWCEPLSIASRDAESTRILADSAAARAAWRSLYHDGPVVLSLYGWVAAHVPDPEQVGIAGLAASPIPNLLSTRNLAEALATEARLAVDPRPALADLDALVAAEQQSGTMIDAMIRVAVSAVRDDAWLEAVARGAVDPQSWCSGPLPDPLTWVADGFAGERMMFSGGYVQDIQRGVGHSWAMAELGWMYGSGGFSDRIQGLAWGLGLMVNAPHDAAFCMREVTRGEVLARTGHGDAAAASARLLADRWRLPLSSMALPNLSESIITAAGSAIRARMARLAGSIAWEFHRSGTLPVDGSHLPARCADLAAATPLLPALRYTRLSATRFRLSCDPVAPAPDLLPPSRIEVWKPVKQPFKQTTWGLEWELAPQP